MADQQSYDIAIIGGGLAGLSLSIQLQQLGYSVVLFEKEQYPFHKVCGEYISLESWDFLLTLGLPLAGWHLPVIKKLVVTAPGGQVLKADLPLGGFGISRYKLDNALKNIAVGCGVKVYENCKVEDIKFTKEIFTLSTPKVQVTAKVCCGSFGKRSNIDLKMNRSFTLQKKNKLDNYIGVKYHVRCNHPSDTIALHNFENGYCGISQVEDGIYCLCYLTNAANLQQSGNSIQVMERNVLQQNDHLRKIFNESEIIYQQPVTISQISFAKKTQVQDNIIFLGDAAGMITPLCGNGMSMALHASKIAATCIPAFLQGKMTRHEMEQLYTKKWQETFSKRLAIGRMIQRLFGKSSITNVFVACMKLFPSLTRRIIRSTHGELF